MTDETQALRQSILRGIDQKYAELVTMIKMLPFDQNEAGMTFGCAFLDTSKFWFQTRILSLPVLLPSTPPSEDQTIS